MSNDIPANFDPTKIDPLNMTLHQMQQQLWANSKKEDGLGSGTSVTDVTSVAVDPNSTSNKPTAYELALADDKAEQLKKAQSIASANRALRNLNRLQ